MHPEGHEIRIHKPLHTTEVLPGEVRVLKAAEDDISGIRHLKL